MEYLINPTRSTSENRKNSAGFAVNASSGSLQNTVAPLPLSCPSLCTTFCYWFCMPHAVPTAH